MREWDVSDVTDMSGLFRGRKGIPGMDLGCWEVDGVRNMQEMFKGSDFEGKGLENWTPEKCENYASMFEDCPGIEIDLKQEWGQGRNYSKMFKNSNAVLHGLNELVLTHAQNTDEMFYNCELINPDVSYWEMGEVESMRGMFAGCKAFEDWTLSNGLLKNPEETMRGMFSGCDDLNCEKELQSEPWPEDLDVLFSLE